MAEIGLNYFFPGSCYKTVVEEHNFYDGKLAASRLASDAYFCLFVFLVRMHENDDQQAP